MNKLALIAFVLCSCATACNREDTAPHEKWPRTVEPRLSNATWQPCSRVPPDPDRVVQSARCGLEQPATEEPCDKAPPALSSGLGMLATKKRCTDEAVGVLEKLAAADTSVLSDLAAAYYVRAQREDRASDLLLAFNTASRAVRIRPTDAAARFNLALIQEAIGLREDALATWKAIPADGTEWATEAQQRRARLESEVRRDPSTQWDENRKSLPNALRTGNAALVSRLITAFPKSALQYFEEELLPQGDARAARLFATELSKRLGGDRYVIDVAAAASRNREGHLAFAQARRLEYDLQRPDAAKSYARATELLRREGSPLHLQAERGGALNLSLSGGAPAASVEMLAQVEQAAGARHYRYLAAVTRATAAFIRDQQDRHLEALADYEAASKTFVALSDLESLASLYRSTAGVYRKMGLAELAWREALRGLRYEPATAELRIRHTALGEASNAALALDHPHAALRLQESAMKLIQRRLTGIDPARTEAIEAFLRRQLAVALRERARIEFILGDFDAVRRDLDIVAYLAEEQPSGPYRRAFESRVAEIKGKSLLSVDPAGAAVAFTEALTPLKDDEQPTLRTTLRIQRAEAYRRSGRPADAERDLTHALADLRKEESSVLANRKRGEREDVWASYFARFDEAYERLIAQLVAQGGKADAAFDYAERSRAFEPLDLVLQLPSVPPAFRQLTKDGNPVALAAIQRSLPSGTFLLQYCVTDDRTYTWIVSNSGSRIVDQEVPRQDIRRWSAALQRAGRGRDAEAFDAGSYAPYDKLLRKPLLTATSMNAGNLPSRLVIVPDDAMHGLPFAALRHPDTRRYLVQDTTIEIAGSATLYVFSLMRNDALTSPAPPSVLLIGDPAFNEGLTLAYGLDRLGGAAGEVEKLRTLYAPHVEVRTGVGATIPELLKLARDKTVFHFAGHSIANPKDPSRSLLLLAPSPNRDGALEAQELLTGLKLEQARLVVLAACSTAGGLPVGNEGVAPLVRPFIAAGVPAVIGTLWDVNDATAEALFVSFHHDYRQGSDAAAALRAAQLKLLGEKDPGLQSVLTWAPFQVIGHASSPFGPANHK